MALTFLFGWFLMKQLDRFLYENQKRIRLDTIETAAFWCYNTIKRGGETVQNNENNLSKEHILVCLSSSPSNERIVRMAGKMAQAFCGSLTALYVQTPGYSGMNAEDIARLQANIRLAQRLGAEIITTHGEDVPTQIAEYARLSDVTKIVIGRSGVQRQHFWSEPTLTEQLITLAPEMDIHIIPDAEVYKSYPRKSLFAYTATGQIQQISEYGNQLQQNSNNFRKRIKRLPEMLIRLVRDFLHEIVHRLTLKVRIIQ